MSDFWDRLTVVFIVHNSISVIRPIAESLRNAKNIIVIDNASSDGSADLVRECLPAARIIHNPDNTGVSMPSNVAFTRVETEFVLHLNPDTTFDDECIGRLVADMDADPKAAVVSPLIINANGDHEIDVMGPGEITHRKIETPPSGPLCTWYVCGSVWLWRTDVLKELGGFDPNFFLYNEDVDICLRTRALGYGLILDTEAVIHHRGGASEHVSYRTRWRKDWNLMWSHFYLVAKHRGRAQARAEALRRGAGFLASALLGMLLLKPKRVVGQLARFAAAVRFLRGGPSWGRIGWVAPQPYCNLRFGSGPR